MELIDKWAVVNNEIVSGQELWQTSGFGVLSADFKTASQSGNLFSFCFLFCFAASKYSFLSFLYYSYKVFLFYRKNSILKLIPRQVFKWLATLSNSMTPPTLHLSHLNWCSVSKWPSNFSGLAVLNGSFFASSHHGQLSWFHNFFIRQFDILRFLKICKTFLKRFTVSVFSKWHVFRAS